MGFALAFGILLASLVVSSILVPAVTALVGHAAPADRRTRTHRRLPLRRSGTP